MKRRIWGQWENIGPLAEGGQGHTFLVQRKGAPESETCVLKRLKNTKRLDRFSREVEIGLTLRHPHIVPVLDYSLVPGEESWFVMPFYSVGILAAVDLASLDIPARLYLFRTIVDAVAFAHDSGVIHRDLKPDNIFLNSEREPFVGDFGLCFLEEGGERFTLLEEGIGPRFYMAPELEDGRVDQVTSATDVYSLGKLLYWLLAGRIFAREKHRYSQYDLRRNSQDSMPALVYELLDETIVYESRDRLTNGRELLERLTTLIRRVSMNANVVDIAQPQYCTYCGDGKYKIEARPDTEDTAVENFGFNNMGDSRWLILVCENCGHVQLFRPDLSSNPGAWNRSPLSASRRRT